ncbi:hypothetical protein BDZ94DRAFT_1253368 [Collybia nuda]|uniref:Uncharacterized protein n=1 Tax=Collybia nuda TaxID=64659 RepID=A0A9P5Y8X9_9AGAR|nr:hypothetical protein BDZ94DRAFT_1253368 [Collybia nuda]
MGRITKNLICHEIGRYQGTSYLMEWENSSLGAGLGCGEGGSLGGNGILRSTAI